VYSVFANAVLRNSTVVSPSTTDPLVKVVVESR
jgi:hypothetical protein